MLFLTLEAGGTGTTAAPQEDTITLMSYNAGAFRKHSRDMGHYSFEEAATVINSAAPCVVGLNETDWRGARSGGIKQAKRLAKTLGSHWSWKFYPAAYSWYGNSIVWDRSRRPARQICKRVVLKKTDGSEVRSMGAVEFSDFVFCATHLDHVSETDRLNAIDKITAWAAERYGSSGKPVFLVGDMNAAPSSTTVAKLRENWIQLSGEGNTYPSDPPRKCIDYIFLYKNGCEGTVELISSGVVSPDIVPDAAIASDHCPVWATVRLQ